MMRLLPFILLFFSCNNNTKQPDAIPTTADTVSKTVLKSALLDSVKAGRQTIINSSADNIPLVPHPIALAKDIHFTLNIPAGYGISVAAEGLKRLRFLSLSPDQRLFATDMYDRSDNKKGKVLIFSDWNDSTKKFGRVITYLDGLHNPNQVAFYDRYLYVAETGALKRYEYNAGDTVCLAAPVTIASFPDYGLSYKYGGWHLTRSIAFHNHKLYVSIGSSCNACIETENERAVILEMNPDGSDKKIYARGLRNSVGMKWIGDNLWVTTMGRDLIGPDKPEDLLEKVDSGGYYGWPFYYQYQNKIFADTQFKDSTRTTWIKEPPLAYAGFKAHSAPLGFEYLQDFEDAGLQNSILACLHGSTSVWRQRGNSIVKVVGGNRFVDIVTGFLTGKTENDRHGRPCDILMRDNKSFYFTDDLNGVLYYMWKE